VTAALATQRTVDVEIPTANAGRLPPHSLEAEASVLSAVMLDPTAIAKIDDFLRPEHMYSQAHRYIFAACVSLKAEGSKIDVLMVQDWLKDRGRLAQIGGAGYLTEILDACPVVTNVRQHALIVFEKWRVRQVILTCQRIAAVGYGDYGPPQAFCEGAAKAMIKVAKQTVIGRPPTNLSVLSDIARRLSEKSTAFAAGTIEHGRRVSGIETGIHSYDKLTHGLHSGQKTTIVAHPGVGKTALVMQIGWNVSETGVGVLAFSTEMTQKELLEREICRRAQIPFDRLQSATLSAAEWSRLAAASSEIAKLPMVIDPSNEIDIDQICATATAHAETMLTEYGVPLGLIIVDFIQNLKPAREVEHKDERHQVTYSTVRLKRLLSDLKIPGIELAQRKQADVDPKTKLRPTPAKGCAADSSWIEKMSYVVVCIQRDPLYGNGGGVIGEDEHNLTLHVVKHRGGKERPVPVRFDGEYFRFTDPNAPSPTPSRQYIDTRPEPEPPADRFDSSENHFTEGL
jgi:replicative DNA helicase